MVKREEVELTEEGLGRGGWGEVKVAKFRGLRVAAKFLHDMIISEYNQQLFSREMTIAAKIRHAAVHRSHERGRGSHTHRAYAYQPAQGATEESYATRMCLCFGGSYHSHPDLSTGRHFSRLFVHHQWKQQNLLTYSRLNLDKVTRILYLQS